MNGNPFYVDPFGGFGKEIVQGLSGLGAVLGQQQELKKQKAIQDQARELFASGDPGKIAEFSLANPEIGQQVASAIKFKNDQTKQNMLDSMRRIIGGEDPRKVILERAQMVQAQGGDPIDTLNELAVYDENPQAYPSIVANAYAALDPRGFLEYRQATAGQKGEVLTGEMGNQALAMFGTSDVSRLSPQQRQQLVQGGGMGGLTATQKDYQLARKEGFEGSFIDYQKALKGGPDADIKTMMLQTQLLDLQDRIQERQGKLSKEERKTTNEVMNAANAVLEASSIIPKSTGSFLGNMVDKGAAAFGVGTEGAENIAKLEVIGSKLVANVPRFEGPQSNADVQSYKQAAADVANPNKPANVRLEALKTAASLIAKDAELKGIELPENFSTFVYGAKKNDGQKPAQAMPQFSNSAFVEAAKRASAKEGRTVTVEEFKKRLGM